jgi:hypothetical protein
VHDLFGQADRVPHLPLWLSDPAELGEEWKPDHSKIVLVAELEGNRIAAHVDPQRPDAWRREPYYSRFKEWAESAVPYRGQVVACIGRHMHMIFPEETLILELSVMTS